MENFDSEIIPSPQEIDYMQSFLWNIEPLGNSSNQNLSITFRKKLKLPKLLSVYILLLPFLITFHYSIFWSGWVCIPLSGNIPLRENSVSILLISSERVGIFNSILQL